MNHTIILPILLPLIIGLALLIVPSRKRMLKHMISMTAIGALILVSLILLADADAGNIQVYALGNWQPPFGIVLVLDRLSAIMLVLSSTLAFFCMLYTTDEDAPQVSIHFHSLAQLLIAGVNGAFLTGDLFNLFVFFEILLVASYGLLMLGHGARRARAGLHYVLLNVLGSSIFLIGIAIIYGTTGTLNMADLAHKLANAEPENIPLIATGGMLLLVVFGLKGALFPLYFWLPSTYAAASAPVAALFSIMTKVGIYSIIRVFSLMFGANAAGDLANLIMPWLWPMAFITLILGAFGAIAARELRVQVSYLVVISAGTLLTGIALNSAQALSAVLFYLLHSTWVCAALFLIVDLVIRQRGFAEDKIIAGPEMQQALLIGALFFVATISVVGMPPLSGFIGKALILQASSGPTAPYVWGGILIGGLGVMVALSRSGSTIFWRMKHQRIDTLPIDQWSIISIVGLLGFSIGLMFAGNQVIAYTNELAIQVLDPDVYIHAVLTQPSAVE